LPLQHCAHCYWLTAGSERRRSADRCRCAARSPERLHSRRSRTACCQTAAARLPPLCPARANSRVWRELLSWHIKERNLHDQAVLRHPKQYRRLPWEPHQLCICTRCCASGLRGLATSAFSCWRCTAARIRSPAGLSSPRELCTACRARVAAAVYPVHCCTIMRGEAMRVRLLHHHGTAHS